MLSPLCLLLPLAVASGDIAPLETDAPRLAEPAPVSAAGPTARGPSLTDTLTTPRHRLRGITLGDIAWGTAMSITRPVRPEVSDAWVIIPMLAGAVVAVHTDVATHRALRSIPDPVIAGERFSYWGSMLGEGWVDLLIFGLLGALGGERELRASVAGIEALAAAGVASRVGKLIFRLERPSYDPNEHHWFSRTSADAMPSGHTMAAFATASVLAEAYPRFKILFYALAAYVGVARVQQSTHWVSDVVVGAALGTLFGWEAWKVTEALDLDVRPWARAEAAGLQVSSTF